MSVLYSMANTSANVWVEFRKFEDTGFDLWKIRMESKLYLQGCVEYLEENKSADMYDGKHTFLTRMCRRFGGKQIS